MLASDDIIQDQNPWAPFTSSNSSFTNYTKKSSLGLGSLNGRPG